MGLSSKEKKRLYKSFQQQRQSQKLAEVSEAKSLFAGLMDLEYETGYRGEHMYFKYLLLSNGQSALTSEDDSEDDAKNIALLDVYYLEEINSRYIIRVAGKGFTAIDHPSEIYKIPDAHECINGNQPLRPILDIDARQKPDPANPELPSLDGEKITRDDLMSRILIACADALNLIPECIPILKGFALAGSSNIDKCSWHIIYPYG